MRARRFRFARAALVVSWTVALAGLSGTHAGCRAILDIEKKGCNRCAGPRARLDCDGDEPRAVPCAADEACHAGECVPSIISLSASHTHACAVRSDGSVWCWGSNSDGQLGGTGDAGIAGGLSTVPIQVRVPPSKFVAAGALHTCVITRSGEVHCWGSDQAGQSSGSGQIGATVPPTRITFAESSPPTFKSISGGGAHTCALSDQGNVYCWGANYLGQCGVDPQWSASPIPAPACQGRIEDVIALYAPGDPVGLTLIARPPTRLPSPLQNVSAVVAMKHHTCASVGSSLYCWGSNCSTADDLYGLCCDHGGMLGDDPSSLRYSASPLLSMSLSSGPSGNNPAFLPFAVGYASVYSIVRTTSGNRINALGSNERGQLGVDANDGGPGLGGDQFSPVLVRGVTSGVSALLSSNGSDACAFTAIDADKRAYCWGTNDCGELGATLGCESTPLPPTELTFTNGSVADLDVTKFVRGDDFGCAVKAAELDTVVCWGDTRTYGTGGCSRSQCAPELIPVLTSALETQGQDSGL